MTDRSQSPIPPPVPTDHEDVSWALSTAEANWRRGDAPDALKWLQRAAEAASEAGLDARYLELAKAASALAAQVESSPKLPPLGEEPHPSGATLVQPMGIVLPDPAKKKTPLGGSSVPPARPSAPAGASNAPRPSAKPAPNTNPGLGAVGRGSKAPAAPSASRVPPPAGSRPQVSASTRSSGPPKPPAPLESGPELRRPEGATENLRTVKNLDKMAHLAALTRSERPRAPDPEDMTQVIAPDAAPSSVAPATEVAPAMLPPEQPSSDPSLEPISEEPWPTQTNSKSSDAVRAEVERVRRASAAPPPADATLVPDPNAPQPTQALRVTLLRTADGIRIVPYGSKVQAMSLDAILVALDPSTDLAAWIK